MQIQVSERQKCSNMQYGDDGSRHWGWGQLLLSHHIRASKGLHQPHYYYSQPVSVTLRLTSALGGSDEGQLESQPWWRHSSPIPIFSTITTIPCSCSPPAVSDFATSTDSCVFWDESSILSLLSAAFSSLSLSLSPSHSPSPSLYLSISHLPKALSFPHFTSASCCSWCLFIFIYMFTFPFGKTKGIDWKLPCFFCCFF